MKKSWILSYLLSSRRRPRSDWADAQADLSHRWVPMPFCWFCHEAAHMVSKMDLMTSLGTMSVNINYCITWKMRWDFVQLYILAPKPSSCFVTQLTHTGAWTGKACFIKAVPQSAGICFSTIPPRNKEQRKCLWNYISSIATSIPFDFPSLLKSNFS